MIKNKYNERLKEYEENMKLISTFERRQQWSALYTASTKFVEQVFNLRNEIAKLESKIRLIGSTL